MLNRLTIALLLLGGTGVAIAQDAGDAVTDDAPAAESVADDAATEDAAAEAEAPAAEPGGPKEMSGMSILGNEEAPKSLVIVPWKSSELGDSIGLTDTLDDRAKAVDKEVFLRELAFHQIRASE